MGVAATIGMIHNTACGRTAIASHRDAPCRIGTESAENRSSNRRRTSAATVPSDEEDSRITNPRRMP
jgi:hypothetical protein